MHAESGDIQVYTLGRREATDKPVRKVTGSYRGGQPKLSHSGLLCLRPGHGTFTRVSGSRDYNDTWSANNDACVVLLMQVAWTEIELV